MKWQATLFLLLFGVLNLIGQPGQVEAQLAALQDSLNYYQLRIKGLQVRMEDVKLAKVRQDIRETGLPKVLSDEAVIEHLAMSLVYDERHEQAKWVAHIITPDIFQGREGRTNDFRPDSLVKTGSAVEADYFLQYLHPDSTIVYDAFGYDRGHLAPSADFRWSQRALSESYFYSNMSPQLGEFNRDSWAKLEDMFRAYLYKNPHTQLYVVTGPVLHEALPVIERGVNKVSVPETYFKIGVDLENKYAIAFVMPNAKADNPYAYYARSIDEVEQLTGIDFFPQLEDGLENLLEAQKDPAPMISFSEEDDVAPIHPTQLQRGSFNTVQAASYVGRNETITVCGTVVSAKLSSKGNIFLNLDRQYPNQTFSVTIFKDKAANFSYAPDETLIRKQICVRGKVTNFNGTPSMVIENENAIEVLEE
jgi:endonuclease G